jgi:hypothetical protein
MKISKIHNYFFGFIFIFSIIMPVLFNKFGNLGVMLVNGPIIILIFAFILFANGTKLKCENKIHKKILFNSLIPLLIYLIILPLSMTSGLFFGEINIIERDFYEFYRPIFYILTFIFSFFYFSKDSRCNFLENLLFFIFIITVLFGLNQFFRFNDWLTELYTKPHNISSGRISSPFVNPYDYAFFMSFFVYYYFTKFLLYKYYYFFLFIISTIMLVLPQSRSILVGFLVGFFIIVPLFLTIKGVNLKKLTLSKRLIPFYSIIFLLICLIILLIPYLIENFGYLMGQFIRLFEDGEIGGAANTRLNQLTFALSKAVDNPFIFIFGNGPAKNEMEYVESIYTYLFYRHGILGITIYFYFLFISIFYLFRILKKMDVKLENYTLFLALLFWFVTIPFLSIGNNMTEQVRSSFFYYMLSGFIAASYYKLQSGRST